MTSSINKRMLFEAQIVKLISYRVAPPTITPIDSELDAFKITNVLVINNKIVGVSSPVKYYDFIITASLISSRNINFL